MSIKELTKYLNNPLNLKKLSIGKIQELIQSNPSFPALYHLLAEKTADFPETERKEIILNIATHTPNRALLFQQLFGKKGIDREVRNLLRTANIKKKSVTKEEVLPVAKKEAIVEKALIKNTAKKQPAEINEKIVEVQNAENVSSFANWLTGMSMERQTTKDETAVSKVSLPVKQETPKEEKPSEPIKSILKKSSKKPKVHIAPSVKASKPKATSKKAKKQKKKDKVQNIIDRSVVEGTETISETLAMLLARQGYHDKAIRMYEKLSLNNPQKSALFAEQIEKIRNKQK